MAGIWDEWTDPQTGEVVPTHHGLSWADFVMLKMLNAAGGSASTTELARIMRMTASRSLLRLLPLEKTGLV